MPIGIRPESNVTSLSGFMRDNQQSFVSLSEVHLNLSEVLERIAIFCDSVDHIYLTIDMDAFPSAYAPGVSASAPDGMLPFQAIEIIKKIMASEKWLSSDVVEVNPDFDIDNRTSKLAAELIYHITHG